MLPRNLNEYIVRPVKFKVYIGMFASDICIFDSGFASPFIVKWGVLRRFVLNGYFDMSD